MKKILSLCLVLTVLLSCVGCGKTETTNNDSVNTTESTTETTTESTTETTTETTTEKKTETTTNKNVENTTKKPETTTKKPNKPETTTKKPVVTTTRPTTTQKEELHQSEIERVWAEVDCWSEAEYKAYVASIPTYKCKYCGNHNCPALTYGPNRLGDIVVRNYDDSKCPAIINEKAKCQHCSKILSDTSKSRSEPDKYCDGYCYISFG